MCICLKSSNIEGNLGRSASYLISVYAKYCCPLSDQKTHCFQSYNQGYRKSGNN